jgi:O-antigen/teichoic acid export membrane protein
MGQEEAHPEASPRPPEGARPAATAPGGQVARNAAHLVLGQAATTALAVVLSAVLGRSLGAAEFGLYFLFTSMTTFAYVVVGWGQAQYVIREVARHPSRADALLANGVALRVAGTLAAVPVTAAVTALLGYDRRTCALATLMLVTLLPSFVTQAHGSVFRGHERMEYDALVSVLNKLLLLLLTVPALLMGTGLPGVILAQGAAGLGALALAAALSRRLGVRARGLAVAVSRELLVGGTPLVAMSLAISAQGYIDAVVLSKLAPEQAVGWYGAARSVLGTLIAPATIIGSAAFPSLSRAAADPPRFREVVRETTRPLLLLAGYAAVGTWLFADLAIAAIYGAERFAPAALILRVFAPGFFLVFVDMVLGSAIIAAGRSTALAASKAVNVAAATALELLLVPWFQAHHGNGGMGVVVAFGVSELVMFVAAVLLVPPGAIGRSTSLDMGRAVLTSAGTVAVVMALPALGPLPLLIVMTLAFLALAWALGLVGRDDLARLSGLVLRRGATAARER